MKKAKESAQIKRTRDKLKRRLSAIDEKITPTALKEVAKNIHDWINRHKGERKKIEGTVKLFDENLHSAQIKDSFVQQRLNQLKMEKQEESKMEELRGRVSNPPGY